MEILGQLPLQPVPDVTNLIVPVQGVEENDFLQLFRKADGFVQHRGQDIAGPAVSGQDNPANLGRRIPVLEGGQGGEHMTNGGIGSEIAEFRLRAAGLREDSNDVATAGLDLLLGLVDGQVAYLPLLHA